MGLRPTLTLVTQGGPNDPQQIKMIIEIEDNQKRQLQNTNNPKNKGSPKNEDDPKNENKPNFEGETRREDLP